MRDVCFIADVAVLPRWMKVSQALDYVAGVHPRFNRDEPTLGLDILFRKQFYDSLLNDYFDQSHTIIVTTHQVDEIQDVLTDLMFINRGRIALECSMEEFESRYAEVMVRPEHLAAAQALRPMHTRQVFGRSVMLFENIDRQQLAALGDVRTPGIADLFVAIMGDKAIEQQGAAK